MEVVIAVRLKIVNALSGNRIVVPARTVFAAGRYCSALFVTWLFRGPETTESGSKVAGIQYLPERFLDQQFRRSNIA
jgi:hypothetical protein